MADAGKDLWRSLGPAPAQAEKSWLPLPIIMLVNQNYLSLPQCKLAERM